MSSPSRARLTIDPAGNWQQYGFFVPEYCAPIGTASLGSVDGILVHQLDGLYCLIHSSGILKLDQRKAKAALGISNNAGAPAKVRGKNVNVYLDPESQAIAIELGGNVSAGIRIALRQARVGGTE